MNLYDWCVAKIVLCGKQITSTWHVDDFNILHENEGPIDELISALQSKYGRPHKPLTECCSKVHDSLGMVLDYLDTDQERVLMDHYVEGILDNCPNNMKGTAMTPARNKFFDVDDYTELLDSRTAEMFHYLVAWLLYLSQHGQPWQDWRRTIFEGVQSFLNTQNRRPCVSAGGHPTEACHSEARYNWSRNCRRMEQKQGSDNGINHPSRDKSICTFFFYQNESSILKMASWFHFLSHKWEKKLKHIPIAEKVGENEDRMMRIMNNMEGGRRLVKVFDCCPLTIFLPFKEH